MKSFLIVYMLHDHEAAYPIISKKIQSFSNWIKLFDRTWIVKSNLTAVEIRNDLASAINRKGSIFVVEISQSSWATSQVKNNVNDWIHKNL